MADKLIISDDRFSLYLIERVPNGEWVNFRNISRTGFGEKILRSRLAYNRIQRRLAESKSAKNFRRKNPDDLLRVTALIERAIEDGLV